MQWFEIQNPSLILCALYVILVLGPQPPEVHAVQTEKSVWFQRLISCDLGLNNWCHLE